jgi:hypothetical protein
MQTESLRPQEWPQLSPHGQPLARSILIFFVPGHLDGFELRLVRFGLIVGESRQFGDITVQIREAHGQRIDIGVFFLQLNPYLFRIIPGELLRHGSPVLFYDFDSASASGLPSET